jgi:hypothetical protein
MSTKDLLERAALELLRPIERGSNDPRVVALFPSAAEFGAVFAASVKRTVADCHEGIARAVLAENTENENKWENLLEDSKCLTNQQSNFSLSQHPDCSEISLDTLMQPKKPTNPGSP